MHKSFNYSNILSFLTIFYIASVTNPIDGLVGSDSVILIALIGLYLYLKKDIVLHDSSGLRNLAMFYAVFFIVILLSYLTPIIEYGKIYPEGLGDV